MKSSTPRAQRACKACFPVGWEARVSVRTQRRLHSIVLGAWLDAQTDETYTLEVDFQRKHGAARGTTFTCQSGTLRIVMRHC